MKTRIFEVTFNRKTYFDSQQTWTTAAANVKEAIAKVLKDAKKDHGFNNQNLHTIESVKLVAEA